MKEMKFRCRTAVIRDRETKKKISSRFNEKDFQFLRWGINSYLEVSYIYENLGKNRTFTFDVKTKTYTVCSDFYRREVE